MEGARLVYRGLWRSKEGSEPTEAEATAVDMVSTEDCTLVREKDVVQLRSQDFLPISRRSQENRCCKLWIGKVDLSKGSVVKRA
jgi:hypothetical protein